MTILIRFSFLLGIAVLTLGASSCNKKLDGFKCVTLIDPQTNERYMRCRNSATKESLNAPLSLIGKCVRNNARDCEWILTDLEEYELLRQQVNEKCKVK